MTRPGVWLPLGLLLGLAALVFQAWTATDPLWIWLDQAAFCR